MGGPSGPLEPRPAVAIIILVVVPAVGATILLALPGKYVARPIRPFWIISGVLFVVSSMMPLFLSASLATSSKNGLRLMHPIVWAVIAGVGPRWTVKSKPTS